MPDRPDDLQPHDLQPDDLQPAEPQPDAVPDAARVPDAEGSSEAPVVPPGVPVAEALGLTPASEVARSALERARAAARARGFAPGRPAPRRGADADRGGRDGGGWSGARPGSGRDPVLLGDTLARLAAEHAWTEPLSVGGVVGRWREVVGDQIADHTTPETFEDGLLVVRADSTTWAANLRLLVPQLLARLAQEVGPDVVREIRVLGPVGPRWSKGKRSVRGRGPRDTYG